MYILHSSIYLTCFNCLFSDSSWLKHLVTTRVCRFDPQEDSGSCCWTQNRASRWRWKLSEESSVTSTKSRRWWRGWWIWEEAAWGMLDDGEEERTEEKLWNRTTGVWSHDQRTVNERNLTFSDEDEQLVVTNRWLNISAVFSSLSVFLMNINRDISYKGAKRRCWQTSWWRTWDDQKLVSGS